MCDAIPEGELPDDPAILGTYKALRRALPARYSTETGEPDSSTFDKDGEDPGTSVTLWLGDGDLEIISAPHPTFGVLAIYVQVFRDEGLRIALVDEEGNPNHCEVYGPRSRGKRKRLSAAARWVKYPEGFPEELKPANPLWTREGA